jgi:Mn-dependent DtxR family transcriptional regulator
MIQARIITSIDQAILDLLVTRELTLSSAVAKHLNCRRGRASQYLQRLRSMELVDNHGTGWSLTELGRKAATS